MTEGISRAACAFLTDGRNQWEPSHFVSLSFNRVHSRPSQVGVPIAMNTKNLITTFMLP